MKVSELGEFGIIERLRAFLASHGAAKAAGRLAAGIGDDAAVWRTEGGVTVATTDTLVAGVHFLPERTPWRDTGWKALAVNVSDVAAMGATPDFALVTLGLPADTPVAEIDELYAGLAEAGEAYGVSITGGDIVRAPTFFISVALTGYAGAGASGEPLVMRRSAALAGDLLAVSGSLGGAAGGLHALQRGCADMETLIARHARPPARLQTGLAAREAGVRCAIDVSDGLLQDLSQICRASGVGAAVRRDALPIDPALAGAFEAEEALRFAVAGGEDYELLLAGSRQAIEAAARSSDVPLTIIGEIVADPEHRVTLLDASGRELAIPEGWDHLRSPD